MQRVLACVVVWACWCGAVPVVGQSRPAEHDRAVFVDDTDVCARRLATQVSGQEDKSQSASETLKASSARIAAPSSPEEFQRAWHHPPVLQGLTGQCWAFAATSFFESEIHRSSRREIKLSEMYTVYWEFVEKARQFVTQHGDFQFGRGSEADATIRIWKRYGIVPAAAYAGRPPSSRFYDDRRMFGELRSCLASVKQRGEWDEASVLTKVRAILDQHMGPPPTSIEVDGQGMSPQDYLRRVVRLDLDNYVNIISMMQEPYDRWCEYRVPDNWRHSRNYYNVALDDFVRIIRDAAVGEQSLCLTVDNTEPGFLPREDIAFVPSFDIPSAGIDENARQYRFSTEATSDDHVVHLVGAHRGDPDRWYLIKDSDTKPRNGHHQGYMFYHEDYIKLKALAITLPRDFAEKSLGRSLK